MESENLSSLIRLSVSDCQKTDSSNEVSFIGILIEMILIFKYLISHFLMEMFLTSLHVG